MKNWEVRKIRGMRETDVRRARSSLLGLHCAMKNQVQARTTYQSATYINYAVDHPELPNRTLKVSVYCDGTWSLGEWDRGYYCRCQDDSTINPRWLVETVLEWIDAPR